MTIKKCISFDIDVVLDSVAGVTESEIGNFSF